MFTRTSGRSSVTTNVVGTVVDEAAEALLPLEFRLGHSFFQCPFFKQILQ
jgi:hypothetical protein